MSQTRFVAGAGLTVVAASFVLMLALFVAAPAVAQAPEQKPPGELSDLWMMWPKAGHEQQFEKAVQEHLAWRKTAGEGWWWETYVPVVGTDLTYYVFRSGDHRWADLDAQQAWEAATKASEVFNKNVAPHVERFEHTFAIEDYEHSHWVMADDYKYFRVTEYELNSGAGNSVRDAIDVIHKGLTAGGWTRSYAISRTIGGTGGMTIATPFRSYAEMEAPKPTMLETLTKGIGSEETAKAAQQKLSDGIKKATTTIYMHRPELSTQK